MRTEWINPEALVRPHEGGLSRRTFLKAGALGTSDFRLQVRDNTGTLSYALIRLPEPEPSGKPEEVAWA